MTLTLRDGWAVVSNCWNPKTDWLFQDNQSWHYAYAQFTDGKVYVYPYGSSKCFEFDTIEEAHAYLIKVSSQSPWEVAPC